MRIVLDTNVLVSGVLSPGGAPGRILDLLLAGGVQAVFDDRILAEYREVLARPRLGIRSAEAAVILDWLVAEGELVAAPALEVAMDDPFDLPFLEVAVAAGADLLVTGNLRHFARAAERWGVAAVSPAAALERLAASEPPTA